MHCGDCCSQRGHFPSLCIVDDLIVPSGGQQCGRLSNSEFMVSLESNLGYLPERQRSDVVGLFHAHPTLFGDVPSSTNVLKHDIDVGNAHPVKQHAYRCHIEKRERIMWWPMYCPVGEISRFMSNSLSVFGNCGQTLVWFYGGGCYVP